METVDGDNPEIYAYESMCYYSINDYNNSLKFANNNLKIIAHNSIFRKIFSEDNNGLFEISPDFTENELKEHGANFIPVEKPYNIDNNIIVSGEIPRNLGPTHNGHTFDENGGEDLIKDDMALYLQTKNGLAMITGCGHSGIENIMEYGIEITGKIKYMQ